MKLKITLLITVFTLISQLSFAQKKEDLVIAENKKIVIEFYNKLFGDKDVSAIDKYLAEDYIQHNPSVADGSKALKKAVTEWFAGAPKEKIDIQHVAAEGDLVFLHIKSKTATGKYISIVDIFRVKEGKIVEHWDVMQEVPEKAANTHPMF